MNPLIQIKDPQIIQHNNILLGGQGISLRARQMVYVFASLIDKKSPTDVIRISAKDFLKFINQGNAKKKWSDIYALTSEIFDHLNDNPILLKKPRSKEFQKVNWLSRLGVVSGMIEVRFSADITDYLLYKKGLLYTKLLWDLRSYKSNFTVRILDLFQKHHIKESGKEEFEFEYDLEPLKFFFGVHERYSRLYDFERRVLKVAEEELSSNDDAPYWFEEPKKIKEGKRVKTIKFKVHVRREILLRKIPNLRILKKNSNQPSLFKGDELELSDNQKTLLERLLELRLTEDFALRIISVLTETQTIGYSSLIEYGVNRDLAFKITQDHCSFGELVGYEHLYIAHTLDLIEKARLKRIAAAQNGDTKKRITPKEMRGGLPKKVFEERQHFSSFMEKLSTIRKSETSKKSNGTEGFQDMGNLLKNLRENI